MKPTSDTKNELLRIDLGAVVRAKLGKRARFVPRALVRWMERTICADRLNALLEHNYPKTGAEFCRGVLKDLNVKIHVRGSENLPPVSQRRVVIACNHPLGGLDGMALIEYFTRYFGGEVHFVVNDILMAVKPLSDVFVPVNKHGAQSREASKRIDEVFAGDDPVLVFPAGLCSRLGDDGCVRDLEWHKMFVNRAVTSQRDVIPVHFSGENSRFFYKFARRRKRLGLKLNIEMIYLPREVFRSEGKTFTVTIGKPVSWQTLGAPRQAAEKAAQLRTAVYALADEASTDLPTEKLQ